MQRRDHRGAAFDTHEIRLRPELIPHLIGAGQSRLRLAVARRRFRDEAAAGIGDRRPRAVELAAAVQEPAHLLHAD